MGPNNELQIEAVTRWYFVFVTKLQRRGTINGGHSNLAFLGGVSACGDGRVLYIKSFYFMLRRVKNYFFVPE